MTLTICHSEKTDYAIFKGPSFQLTYRINEVGFLARDAISETPIFDNVNVRKLELNTTNDPIVDQLNVLIAKTVANIHKICAKFGVVVQGTGIDCYENFTDLIKQGGFDQFETLDLSGIKLDLVPFHIELFQNVKTLILSNNNLRVFPPELLNLPNLKIIDLRGNPKVPLPAWLANNQHLTILRDEVKCRPEHLAQKEWSVS